MPDFPEIGYTPANLRSWNNPAPPQNIADKGRPLIIRAFVTLIIYSPPLDAFHRNFDLMIGQHVWRY